MKPHKASAPAPPIPSRPVPTLSNVKRPITRKSNKVSTPNLASAPAVPTMPMNGFMMTGDDIKKTVK